MTVFKYIIQNPVRAGLCDSVYKYEWSSVGTNGTTILPPDTSELYNILPEDEMNAQLDTIIDATPFGTCDRGRKARYSDEEVMELMESRCGTKYVADFQQMAIMYQQEAAIWLRGQRVPTRQIARITGLSRGVIERWVRKVE
jgi:transposase